MMLANSALFALRVIIAACVTECDGFSVNHATSQKSYAITTKPSKWPSIISTLLQFNPIILFETPPNIVDTSELLKDYER